jgi:glycosyltransferase involved in cell wall biosynthesis
VNPVTPPVVSLITPTRNRPDLLRRTITSVQQQRLETWEMIVVDDGDGSGVQAVQALNDPRVRAVQNPGSGQVDARNAAVHEARGAILHLLDDDDRWGDAQHLERVVELLRDQQALVYRGGWLVLEDNTDGDWLERGRREFNPVTTAVSLRADNTLLTSGVAYPKALHEELGGFDRDLENYWDWDWFLRVSARYPLMNIDPPAVLMSWRGTNTSHDPHDPRRVALLQRLVVKHGLDPIEPKNHFTVLGPTPETER